MNCVAVSHFPKLHNTRSLVVSLESNFLKMVSLHSLITPFLTHFNIDPLRFDIGCWVTQLRMIELLAPDRLWKDGRGYRETKLRHYELRARISDISLFVSLSRCGRHSHCKVLDPRFFTKKDLGFPRSLHRPRSLEGMGRIAKALALAPPTIFRPAIHRCC